LNAPILDFEAHRTNGLINSDAQTEKDPMSRTRKSKLKADELLRAKVTAVSRVNRPKRKAEATPLALDVADKSYPHFYRCIDERRQLVYLANCLCQGIDGSGNASELQAEMAHDLSMIGKCRCQEKSCRTTTSLSFSLIHEWEEFNNFMDKCLWEKIESLC
jgi:hypothetical protein